MGLTSGWQIPLCFDTVIYNLCQSPKINRFVVSFLTARLSAYPRTLWEGASLGPAVAGGQGILNNQPVLRRALKLSCLHILTVG